MGWDGIHISVQMKKGPCPGHAHPLNSPLAPTEAGLRLRRAGWSGGQRQSLMAPWARRPPPCCPGSHYREKQLLWITLGTCPKPPHHEDLKFPVLDQAPCGTAQKTFFGGQLECGKKLLQRVGSGEEEESDRVSIGPVEWAGSRETGG